MSGHNHHYHNQRYIGDRYLEDSFFDSLKNHMKEMGKSTKNLISNHIIGKATKLTQTNGDTSTVVNIHNGVKVTKTFKNGKLIHTKKEKVENNGNSINMSNGGKGIISINGGGKHVTQDKNGNILINNTSFDNRGKSKTHSTHHKHHTKHHKSDKQEKEKKHETEKKHEKEKKETKKKEEDKEEDHIKKAHHKIKSVINHFVSKLSRNHLNIFNCAAMLLIFSLI
jgi:hypothetical protein